MHRVLHCLYWRVVYNLLTSSITLIHSCCVYGKMVRSMTGPGRRFLAKDLGGIGGAAEELELENPLAIISDDELNCRGMSPFILIVLH